MGYKLMLHNLNPHWINGEMIFDMSPVWHRFGLDALGVNYCSIGSVVDGVSSRFDATSPYYQSWFGGYIVQFPKPHEWSVNDHFRLGVADQKNWLVLYGVTSPFVEVDQASVKNAGNIIVSGYKGKLYRGNIWSNTDVGERKPFLPLPLFTAGGAHDFNKDNPNLHLAYNNLIPKQGKNQPLHSYQKILLEGYIAHIPINQNTTALLYANGASFTDKLGNEHNTFIKIKNELIMLMNKAEIVQVSK